MRYVTNLKIKNFQRILMMVVCDFIIIALAALFSAMLRANSLDINIYELYAGKYREIIIIALSMCAFLGLSNSYAVSWRYAGVKEYFKMYGAMTAAMLVSLWLSKILVLNEKVFVTADYAVILLLCLIGYTIERFFGSFIRSYKKIAVHKRKNASKKRVMIIGAGDTGSALIKSLNAEGSKKPIVIIDDDKKKAGMRVFEIPIIGDRSKIASAVKEYKIQEIIIAIPSSSDSERMKLINICKDTGIKTYSVPSLFELASGKVSISRVKEVTPQELLGRQENIIDGADIFGYIEDKTVLVTGGGGSIGSELCRQISNYNPKRLIIFDIYENNAYELQMELRRKVPELRLEVLIGSVRDEKRLEEVFSKYKPKVVFHAAAHKHVPLMEDSPNEAIKNNVFGTFNVASVSAKYGVERFVLISTDKAVNPTNIMGTSKRIAEMIMQRCALIQKQSNGKTIFTAVRFGNVLGSNGSVIPLFKKQIKEGGPVTVTHPEITRFFMTIPEAAQLVMQAGAYASGGEIFILDMGEPVKIVDLAKNLIELSGYTPDVDIKIEFSGLRPGEKMYEELLLDKQRHTATKHDRIFIEQPINDDAALVSELYALRERLSCEVPIYNELLQWFASKFNIAK